MFGQVQINAPAPLILRLTYVFAIAILPEAVLSSVSGRPTLGNTVRTTKLSTTKFEWHIDRTISRYPKRHRTQD